MLHVDRTKYQYPWYMAGPSWSWSYGSWIYNYQCNQCYHH